MKTSCVGCSATGSWSRTSTSTTASRSRPATPRRTCTHRVCRNPRWRSRSAGGSSRTVRHRSQVNPHVSCVQILCHFFLLYILYITIIILSEKVHLLFAWLMGEKTWKTAMTFWSNIEPDKDGYGKNGAVPLRLTLLRTKEEGEFHKVILPRHSIVRPPAFKDIFSIHRSHTPLF